MKMRKAVYAGDTGEGHALLARAPVIHLATTGADGRPILRALHAVIDGDWVAFHGAPAGEKLEGLGRRVVISAHETVAEIPSWFLDPVRACPATTYFVSVQVEGVLEEITSLEAKARILDALMRKYQPGGGFTPIRAEDPLYTKAIEGLLVAGVPINQLSCKAKLGQNRRLEERRHVVEQLWARGAPGDVAAVDRLVRRFPELAPASFILATANGSWQLGCGLDRVDLQEVMSLLADAYWLADVPAATTRAAIEASAVVTARAASGAIVGFGRAAADARIAWLYDVIVAPAERGKGLGTLLVTRLLEHPAVRGARRVRLGTRDGMDFYRRLGFVEVEEAGKERPYRSTEMVR